MAAAIVFYVSGHGFGHASRTIEVINADITRDGHVTIQDLLALIDRWGSDDGDADLDGDGNVSITDLLIVLSAYGL